MTEIQSSFWTDLQKKWESFNKPANWYVELAGYLIAGFVVGFLVKHAGRLFFWLLLGAVLSLWALQVLQVISIDYSILKSLFGLSAHTSVADIFNHWVEWVKSHVIESVAAVLGFILAWKFA